MSHQFMGALALSLLLAACGGGQSTTPAPVVVLPTCSALVASDAPLKNIGEIQGASDTSALVAQKVTARGVVVGGFQKLSDTVTQLNGFFIQQAIADADPATSEGIFVYAPDATKLNPGDFVQVSGTVSEFGTEGSTVTQIGGTVTVSLCGSGVSIAPTSIALPVANATALERYEGMLVEMNQPLAVTEMFELGRYGQLVLSTATRQFHPNNGNAVVSNAQNLLARIVLDDGSSQSNPIPTPYLSAAGSAGTRRMGDTVAKLTGVMGHNFGAYRIHPTVTPVFSVVNVRTTTPPVVTGTLKVASFNVLNYFTTLNARGANSADEFARQKAKIVEAIAGMDADILGLMEIENNADGAVNDLVAALNTRMGAGTYAAVNSGKFGTDEIKVDMLYKPAKVSRVGGLVLPTGADLTDYTAASGRPPLAQRFASVANGGSFWFVVNHFKSKGSCPASGDVDLGQGCWNTARNLQATALNRFVAVLKAQGENDVLLMGDFNSYLNEDPTKTLESAGNESLLKRMPAAERYTYVFGGETGALDHGYASSTLMAQVSGVNVWHINADEPTVIDYNTEFKTDDRYAATAFRASDHDPVIVGLTLTADTVVTTPILSANIPATAQAATPFSLTVTEALPGGTAALNQLSISWGDGTANTTLTAAGVAAHNYAAAGTFTVTVTLTNSASQTVTRTGSVVVSAAPGGGSGASDLFFSEYIEGSSNNKAIEIYNPTGASVDLTAYTVKLFANGLAGTATPTSTQALTGSLAAGGTLVLVNTLAAADFKVAGSVVSGVTNFNGDDALVLEKSGLVIDRIGQLGTDPGTEWKVGTATTLNATLRRNAAIKKGDSNAAGPFDPSLEWTVFPIDDATGLGKHTVNP